MSLTDKIKAMLFEDTWNRHGSEYMSHPYEQEQHTALTIQPELPIAPSSHADMQLTDTMAPVHDDEYVPTNTKELGSALVALAGDVPHERVSEMYRAVRDLAQKMAEAPEVQAEEPEAIEDLGESLSRYLSRLSEASWSDDDDPRFSSSSPELDDPD